MFKVVLWDYTSESAQWTKKFLKSDGVEIIRTLRPDDPDQADVIMRGDWNFVLIFENGQRELFNEIFKTMREMNVSTNNIVFAKDFNSMLNNPAAVHALMKPEVCDQLYRHWNFFNHRRWHHYISASTGGFHYVGTSADDYIIQPMYLESADFSIFEIEFFYNMVKKYYSVDDSGGGIFLDLGANIGTTGIYFCKKLTPNLKCIAFEPDAENFKLLRVNTILNDVEDKMTLVNCGLGENFDTMTMYISLFNPGANSVVEFYGDSFGEVFKQKYSKNQGGRPTETVKIIPLDAYLAENKIAAEEIKYIWVDTEGFEAATLLGAKNLLMKNPAPVFMEFNPTAWNKSGCFDRFVALLKTVGYSHFVWDFDEARHRKEILRPIDSLFAWKNSEMGFGGKKGYGGNIFLIRAGAVN